RRNKDLPGRPRRPVSKSRAGDRFEPFHQESEEEKPGEEIQDEYREDRADDEEDGPPASGFLAAVLALEIGVEETVVARVRLEPKGEKISDDGDGTDPGVAEHVAAHANERF